MFKTVKESLRPCLNGTNTKAKHGYEIFACHTIKDSICIFIRKKVGQWVGLKMSQFFLSIILQFVTYLKSNFILFYIYLYILFLFILMLNIFRYLNIW